jgi:hypothetical protein
MREFHCRILTALLFLGTALLVAPSSSGATTLYTQPLNNTVDTGLFSIDPDELEANRFNLLGGGTINQVSWYGAPFFNPRTLHLGNDDRRLRWRWLYRVSTEVEGSVTRA